MARHRITWLDVFTDVPLAGNGLAVVHDADGLDDEMMQAFARETGLSETTFVQAGDGEADYVNRIWTITEEVPFAGHPSLGTAVAVALARGEEEVEYLQRTRAGLQPVRVSRDGDRAQASVVQEPAAFGAELDPEALARALGLDREELVGAPRVVSTGLPAAIVPLRDHVALARVLYDQPALAAAVPDGANVYLCVVGGEQARARMFTSLAVEGEDPATGSAAGALTAFLHARDGTKRVEVEQGVEMGRPSRLCCTVEGDRVRVAGGVVVLVTGELRLP